MCIITILVSIIENVEEHASELSCTTCTTCVACATCAIATTVHGITNTERNPTYAGMKLTKKFHFRRRLRIFGLVTIPAKFSNRKVFKRIRARSDSK